MSLFAVAAAGLLFALSLALGGPPRFLPPWTALFMLSTAVLAHLRHMERRAGRRALDSRPDATLFWLCMAFYLASFRWHGGDDIPNSLLPYSILRHGTLSFDPYRQWATAPGMADLIHDVRGRLVSMYPVAPAILALPLYLIPAATVSAPSDVFLHNLSKIAGALITAASVVLVRRTLATRCSPSWAMACALLYGLGSYAYSVSSQALYSHAPALLGAALGIYCLTREGAAYSSAAGLGFALAWAAREDSLFYLAAAGLFLAAHRRDRLAVFLAGAAIPILLNLAYWRRFSGGLRPPYYELQAGLFGGFNASAFIAMLASPSRGMLLYFPAAVFGVWGGLKACRDPRTRWAPYMAAAGVALWVFYCFRSSWTGGTTFGMRYLALPCLTLAVFAGELEPEIRRSPRLTSAWAWTFAFCVLVHMAGADFQWPGARLTLEEQLAGVWSPRQFPLIQLFVDGGPIDATPQPWRTLYGLALLGLVALPAAWMRRWLSTERSDVRP
ncbi:MAG: hypothetical protein A2V88_14455 [Elusimicrobia bacterium RBG_16_66_12]|nr:MAG: hypothetical protein A2V88_14455 [Elusimicrobia bacterium RBG_16_66_12]